MEGEARQALAVGASLYWAGLPRATVLGGMSRFTSAVVFDNVPPGRIAAGNPAKVIRRDIVVKALGELVS